MNTEALAQAALALALDVLAALVILAIGWLVAGWAASWVAGRAERHPRIDQTLTRVLSRTVWFLIVLFTVLAVLNRFGIQTTSIIALIGAAGLALGLALQGALAHIAAGVLLLVMRPFRVGDAVEAGGTTGTVEDIGLVSTRLKTFDGVVVYQPNGTVWSTEIKNYSQSELRRLDLVVGIGYGDDVGTALEVVERILGEDPRFLEEPAPLLAVESLGDNAVNLLIRVWTKPDDLWPARFDLTRRVKEELDAAGVGIPFPQRDIRLVQAEPLEVKRSE